MVWATKPAFAREPAWIFRLSALSFIIVLSATITISPPTLDVVRVHNTGGDVQSNTLPYELRFGIWSYCYKTFEDDFEICSPYQYAYSPTFDVLPVHISSLYTAALAIQPACMAFLIAHLVSFLYLRPHFIGIGIAFLLYVGTFIADASFLGYVKNRLRSTVSDQEVHAYFGAGFWLNFATLYFCIIELLICFDEGARLQIWSLLSMGRLVKPMNAPFANVESHFLEEKSIFKGGSKDEGGTPEVILPEPPVSGSDADIHTGSVEPPISEVPRSPAPVYMPGPGLPAEDTVTIAVQSLPDMPRQ